MTIRWKRLFPAGRVAQLTWSRKSPGETFPLHDHDFPEVFWISDGEMEHTINGTTMAMRRGELMFVRPHDEHAFRGIGAHGGVISNFAVRADIVAHLHARYFSGATHAWWDDAPLPARVVLTAAGFHALDCAARELAGATEPDLLAAERFLIDLLDHLRRRETPGRLESEPHWLAEARDALGDPKHLAAGVRSLARLAGCSPEHLARTVRRVHGITPTDLVNRQRLDWAGSELMFSSRDIADIALAAGFESLSHFYHLFRRRHGVTPRQFRLRARPIT